MSDPEVVPGFEDMLAKLSRTTKDGYISTIDELKENQFGCPLPHYAQWYLFGSTGLRIQVFHSISGAPQSCKSPLLFDLMGHICNSQANGGLGGVGFLFELEDKISPSLLKSVMSQYTFPKGAFNVFRKQTIESAMERSGEIIDLYRENFKACSRPLVMGFDSIGGASAKDTVDKLKKEGYVGKGYHEKPHLMKYFCENSGKVMEDVPLIVFCVNQEKKAAAANPYTPPKTTITGGESQVYKDGHMISVAYRTLASGDGKLLSIRTIKASFSDSRKIEVAFKWNRFGQSEDDYYGHHFEWALASAKCIADPEKGVGEIRDICDVKISDADLVTCPQLGLRSAPAEEFEKALFAPENAKILNDLCVYQKIDKLKGMDEYAEWLKKLHAKPSKKDEEEKPETPKKASKKKGLKQEPPKDVATVDPVVQDPEGSDA